MRKKFTSPLWMWLLLAAAGLAGSGEVAAQAHGIRIANAIDDHHSATELVAATAIPSEGLTQKNSERSVTVQVTPLNVSSGSGTLDGHRSRLSRKPDDIRYPYRIMSKVR